MTEPISVGERAYKLYIEVMQGHDRHGFALPEWDELAEKEKVAWLYSGRLMIKDRAIDLGLNPEWFL